MKWLYIKKCEEEKILSKYPKRILLDEKLKNKFTQIPKNCQHI